MARAHPPYSRTPLLVVILVCTAILAAGLVVLLSLVSGSPELEPEPEEPVTAAAQLPPPAPAPATPDARSRPRVARTIPPRRPPALPPAPPPRRSGPVGVAECDDILDKLATCAANQVKENRRKYINGLLPVYRDSWIRDAKKPEGREALVRSCNKATAHFRITLAEANCDL